MKFYYIFLLLLLYKINGLLIQFKSTKLQLYIWDQLFISRNIWFSKLEHMWESPKLIISGLWHCAKK